MQNCLESNKPCLPISVIADMLGVHQRTLRIYDSEGILVPQRSLKGRRLYSADDIEKGKLIQYMTRELGINLSGIKIIFELLKDIPNGQSVNYLVDIAECAGITIEQQTESKTKLSKRGRKKELIHA